jgi:hypothetical protein
MRCGMGIAGLSLALCATALPQESKPAPPEGIPQAAGVYYLQEPGKWVKVDPVFVDDSKTKGMNNFIYTEGLSGLTMNYIYLGVSAPLQITARRPAFYVRNVGSPGEAQIVQLTQRKDNRTVQSASTEISVGNKGGFKRGEIRPATITALADGSFSIVPVSELKPGEYLLALGSPVTGFDFGITAGKK